MKKLFLFLCAIAFSLPSCTSSDNDTVDDPAMYDVLVKRTVENSEETFDNITYYAYNGKKISNITYSSADYTRQFTYTGDLITNIKMIYNFTSVVVVDENLTYDTSGRLWVYESTKDSEPGWVRRVTFAYSANTVTATFVDIHGSQNYINTEIVFHLGGNGEVISSRNTSYTYNLPDYSYTQNYIYDSKNNPFRNIIGYDKIQLLDTYILNGFTHNVMSVRFNYPDAGIDFVTMTSSYNALNFPVSIETLWFGSNPVTMEYFYE